MEENKMNERVSLTPCEYLMFPIFRTYRSANGIVAYKPMFSESPVIVLKFVEDDGKERMVFAKKPRKWIGGENYYDPDAKDWKVK
jgi:hypothetical protein